jgi:HEAT repeat protein
MASFTLAVLTALPDAISKDDQAQRQVVIDYCSKYLVYQDEELKAAAVACIGRIFRFGVTGLDVTLPCETSSQSVDAVLKGCMSYMDPRVRRAAAESISTLVRSGDSGVRLWVLSLLLGSKGLLSEKNPEVRANGVLALQHLITVAPSPEAWDALVTCMQDGHGEVRNATYVALSVLLRCSENAPDSIFPLLQLVLDNPDDSVRERAMSVVCIAASSISLTKTAAEAAGNLALVALGDSSPLVYLQAFKVLSFMGKYCHLFQETDVASRVLDRVKDDRNENSGSSCEVCKEACRALRAITPRGNPDVVKVVAEALCSCIDSDGNLIVDLANLLSQLADPNGDAVAATGLAEVVTRTTIMACKVAALQGLALVAPRNHGRGREVALDSLRSSNPEVAACAGSVLKRLCSYGDEVVVRALIELATTADRPEPLAALASLCRIGDPAVVAVLRLQLKKGHWPVRRAAVQALAVVVPRGCNDTCSVIEGCLHDSNHDVRQTAVEVLAALSAPGDQQVIDFLEKERNDQTSFHVQMAIDDALETLVALAKDKDTCGWISTPCASEVVDAPEPHVSDCFWDGFCVSDTLVDAPIFEDEPTPISENTEEQGNLPMEFAPAVVEPQVEVAPAFIESLAGAYVQISATEQVVDGVAESFPEDEAIPQQLTCAPIPLKVEVEDSDSDADEQRWFRQSRMVDRSPKSCARLSAAKTMLPPSYQETITDTLGSLYLDEDSTDSEATDEWIHI